MYINNKDLLEQSNVFVKHGRIEKIRDIHMPFKMFCDFNQKRTNNEFLTSDELEFLKTLPKVILEDEYGVSLYNFTGSLSKIK